MEDKPIQENQEGLFGVISSYYNSFVTAFTPPEDKSQSISLPTPTKKTVERSDGQIREDIYNLMYAFTYDDRLIKKCDFTDQEYDLLLKCANKYSFNSSHKTKLLELERTLVTYVNNAQKN